MNIENSLTYFLSQVGVAHRNFLQKAMGEIGLNGGQIFVLIELWKADGQSQIEMVRNLNLTPPTVHKMVKSLEKNGFVVNRQDPDDGRMSRIYLTPSGVSVRDLVDEQWSKLEAENFSVLTVTEKLILQQIAVKLKAGFISSGISPDNIVE